MAGYWVDTDVTVSVQMYVDTDSEESAKALAISRIASNAGYYAQSGLFVDVVVTFHFLGGFMY